MINYEKTNATFVVFTRALNLSQLSTCFQLLFTIYQNNNLAGKISGVVSERDYVCKIALLSKTSKETSIKEISTKSANLIVARPSETVSDCMAKMLLKDIRHLPLLDEAGGVVGIVSIKDLVKAELKEKQEAIKTLSDFALGKGGHFSAE